MERDLHDELIDLGAASIETQGPGLHPGDDFIGLAVTGLSED